MIWVLLHLGHLIWTAFLLSLMAVSPAPAPIITKRRGEQVRISSTNWEFRGLEIGELEMIGGVNCCMT